MPGLRGLFQTVASACSRSPINPPKSPSSPSSPGSPNTQFHDGQSGGALAASRSYSGFNLAFAFKASNRSRTTSSDSDFGCTDAAEWDRYYSPNCSTNSSPVFDDARSTSSPASSTSSAFSCSFLDCPSPPLSEFPFHKSLTNAAVSCLDGSPVLASDDSEVATLAFSQPSTSVAFPRLSLHNGSPSPSLLDDNIIAGYCMAYKLLQGKYEPSPAIYPMLESHHGDIGEYPEDEEDSDQSLETIITSYASSDSAGDYADYEMDNSAQIDCTTRTFLFSSPIIRTTSIVQQTSTSVSAKITDEDRAAQEAFKLCITGKPTIEDQWLENAHLEDTEPRIYLCSSISEMTTSRTVKQPKKSTYTSTAPFYPFKEEAIAFSADDSMTSSDTANSYEDSLHLDDVDLIVDSCATTLPDLQKIRDNINYVSQVMERKEWKYARIPSGGRKVRKLSRTIPASLVQMEATIRNAVQKGGLPPTDSLSMAF